MSDEKEVKRSSFAVALEPEFGPDGKWLGIISAHIEESIEDDLNEEEVTQIRSVCGMMATTLTLMEEDPDFLDYVKGFFIAHQTEMFENFLTELEEKPNFTKDGNVITLNFDTKTHGNA